MSSKKPVCHGNPDINIAADIDHPLPALAQPRARGALRVDAKRRDGLSVIGDLFQRGCLKALFPRGTGDTLCAVFLNTSGGMTGGDKLRIDARAASGSRLTLTSQAAERVYRAGPGLPARLRTRLVADIAARIDWLPQETILFDGSSLNRRLDIDLAADAVFFGIEPVVFGRTAMGESLRSGMFFDNITLRRDGVPVYADAVRLSGDIRQHLSGTGTANGSVAMANVIYAAPDAETQLAPLRALLPDTGGASLVRPGVLVARLLAEDGFALRRALIPIIARLSGIAPPKNWTL
jgi:urease accessory protein